MPATVSIGVFSNSGGMIGGFHNIGISHIDPVPVDTTYSQGVVLVDCSRKVIKEMAGRAARIWKVPEDGVAFENGMFRPASSNVGDFKPLSIADIAKQTTSTEGAIAARSDMNVTGAGPGFGCHIVDLCVDKETGAVEIVRYTVVEDAGKAIHPLQVEGQFQGGAVQGIGWALNEEYIFGEDGKMQNPGFLDYRMPVASDVPNIDTVIVEVPNPKHPFGLRGVGEVPVVPTMAAIANAIGNCIGIRPRSLPMSPPRLLALMQQQAQKA